VRLEAEVDEGAARSIEIEKQDGRFLVVLDGRTIRVDARPLEGFFYSVLIDGIVHEVSIEPDADSWRVQVGTQVHRVSVLDPLRPRGGTGAETSRSAGPVRITAVMPGKVSRVLAKAGSTVAEGQEVLVIEAMKMENAVSSPVSGRLLEVSVSPGDAVEAGATLAVIGPEKI
jgi:biotin carboxyl carrier protein